MTQHGRGLIMMIPAKKRTPGSDVGGVHIFSDFEPRGGGSYFQACTTDVLPTEKQ